MAIILETPRLILRHQTPEDLDDLWALYCDPEITRYIPDAPRSRQEAREELAWHQHGHPRNPRLGLWATIHKATGNFIGRCGLLPCITDGQQDVEIAYTIARDHWGQGLATEAAQAILDYARNQLKVSRLICWIEPENIASQKVAEKIGMAFEREARDEMGSFWIYSLDKTNRRRGNTGMNLKYPETKTVDQVDDYHGVLVSDPYRWLEDVDSPETLDWIRRQNELTGAVLDQIPARQSIRKRLTELWDFAKAWAPYKKGKWYFQERNSGLQNQNVLYVMESLRVEPRLLLDPNRLSEDGTVALTSFSISDDGNWLAYATSASGSDWQTWHIRSVETGQDLEDVVAWSKFSDAAWMPDSSGFYYSRYEAPVEGGEFQKANYNQKVFFHRLNTFQDQDRLVYERPDEPEWGFQSKVTEDGRYHTLVIWQGTDVNNRFFYRDLRGEGSFVELISEMEATYELVGSDGGTFYFFTNLDAPRGKLISIDVDRPQKSNWKTILPEGEAVLARVLMVNDQFAAVYNQDAHHILRLFKRDGSPDGEIPLPDLGSLVEINGNMEFHGSRGDHELFYAFQSFLYPTTVYRYDFRTRSADVVAAPELDFDPTAYETQQVFIPGRDGTRVPMYLTHKKGLARDGQNPTLLYGYGGFNISTMPEFEIEHLVWLELGGVYASANLRGGGEYGEDWHQAGARSRKQNVFDDFIACAEWLIEEKITSTPKLAIEGRSNGGLLIGACMTQRPDLFGACLPAVGVMDMLRFHRFTIGWAWVSDFGSPDDPEEFKTLYAYSPYHNLTPGTAYPATLVTTADHDDRVVPAHSFKFAARLQACQSGDAPVLIRIQTKAGHGFGKPTTILIDELSDIYAFLVQSLRM